MGYRFPFAVQELIKTCKWRDSLLPWARTASCSWKHRSRTVTSPPSSGHAFAFVFFSSFTSVSCFILVCNCVTVHALHLCLVIPSSCPAWIQSACSLSSVPVCLCLPPVASVPASLLVRVFSSIWPHFWSWLWASAGSLCLCLLCWQAVNSS